MAEVTLRRKTMTASGIVSDEPAFYGGFLLGRTDLVNDPTITVYDNPAAASGEMLTPTCEYDASQQGLNGHEKGKLTIAESGIYFEMDENGGTHTAVVYYRKHSEISLSDLFV